MYRFVLTVWVEPDGPDDGVWRGQVKHAQSGAHESFEGLATLGGTVERLCERVKATSEGPGGGSGGARPAFPRPIDF